MGVASISKLKLLDFSGGLNMRDAPSELADNEASDMMNVALDERGGIVKRLGYTKDVGMSAFAADCTNLFYSQVLGQLVVQEGVNVRKRTSAGSFTLVKAFSTSARVTFAEFNDKLLMLHPVDGLFTYTSASVLAGAIGTRKGVAIAVWQNRVFIAVGTAVAAERTRIYSSALGDETGWTVGTNGAASNDLREVDDAPLTALIASARGGLLAFKATSSYRVNDSTTIAYSSIDADTGCASAIAVASYEGTTAVLNERGIYITDGLSALIEASHRIEPLFTPAQLALASLDKFCAVAMPNGDFMFSLRRAGSSANDLTLHYHPTQGWIVPYNFGASAFAVLGGSDNTLYHADPGTARFLYRTLSGGTDNGTAIAAYFQTRWFEPSGGFLTRLQHVRASGTGTFSLYLRRDYEQAGGLLLPFSVVSTGGFVWGTGVWGSGTWATSVSEGYSDSYPRLPARALSFRLEETSSLTRTAPAVLGSGSAPEVGAFALYGLLTDYVELEAI